MKKYLIPLLARRAPRLFESLRSIRNRHYFRGQFSQLHKKARLHLFPDATPIRVKLGPFRDMRYFDETVWGSITPKWLGSYEYELHGAINEILVRSYTTIIDVGCAEGYYAVGLAVATPTARVFAFDTDFISRRQIRRLARLNHVAGRIHVLDFCSHSNLNALSDAKTLVICDIEGCESELLNPELATSLLTNDILVEVHENPASPHRVEHLLKARFIGSHNIERLTAIDRQLWVEENHQRLQPGIPLELLKNAAEENRLRGKVWLWMRAVRST